MDNIETIYLDVREKDEWDEGHVVGAMHFPLIRLQVGDLPDTPKDSEIQVYCRSGGRAEIAKNLLDDAGFKNVINAGGLDDLRIKGVQVSHG